MEFFATLRIKGNQKEYWLIQRTVLMATSNVIWLQNKLIQENGAEMFMPGRVLGDSVENLHTQLRKIDPYPTVVRYL